MRRGTCDLAQEMYLLYSVLLTLGVIALLPRFAYDAFRHGKYTEGLGQRLGRLPSFDRGGSEVIWLHCVSVGETQAARPLARQLRQKFPNHKLVVSTVTATGQRVAREAFKDDASLVFYFPFDWRWTVRRALASIRPSLVVIMETELWPHFLRECKAQDIRVAIVNGRLSDKSFRRYNLMPGFVRRVVRSLDLALMQTEVDADRIRKIGLDASRVMVTGNVKFDAASDEASTELTSELRSRFGFSKERPLVVAASTHAPEERIVIEAFVMLRSDAHGKSSRLLIAPRHPERFADVAAILKESGLSWRRRSEPAAETDIKCEVILLDSIGELRAVYPLAEIVFVGGSIAPAGGHNVLEPAAADTCIVTGPHTMNFAAVVRAFLNADALVQMPAARETDAAALLSSLMQDLLADDARRIAMARRAGQLVRDNSGATERTIEALAILVARAPGSATQAPIPEVTAASST